MKCNNLPAHSSVKRKKKNNKSKKSLRKTINLQLPKDYPWKVLTWLVDDLKQFLHSDDVDLITYIIRTRDLDSLYCLEKTWNLQCYCQNSCADFMHISNLRARYQLVSLLKKFRFPSDDQTRRDAAIEKFIAAEDQCYNFNSIGYKRLINGETYEDVCMFTYMRSFIKQVIGEKAPSKDILTTSSRHGPGASLDTIDGQTSLYFKYKNWPYTCTSSAYPYARFLIQTDKRWLGALEDSYRRRNKIPFTTILDQEKFWADVIRIVPGNRIAFVPKNAQIDRSIAIEPTMNLMLQLGVDGFIRRRLKRFDVDLDSQIKNQRLSYQGSLNPGYDGYVTLDLAAASDTVSLKLIQILFPEDWYDYLIKLRSPVGSLRRKNLVYNKISSMGNGYTFAIESLIFSACCYAAAKLNSKHVDPKTEFCVFGDDLIIRKKNLAATLRILELSGFTLNHDKSFTTGSVRESCGTDWIQGIPVRPIYLTEFPKILPDLFVDINRLKRLLELRWGIRDSITCKNMEKWIPEECRNLIGPYSDEEFSSYLHSSKPGEKSLVKYGFNHHWKYNRLVCARVPFKCNDFLFRKLMHNLRIGAPLRDFNKNNFIVEDADGSRFTVNNMRSFIVGRSRSTTDIWWSTYTENITFSNV